MNSILNLFDFRSTKRPSGGPKKYSCLIKLKIHSKREIFKTEIFKLPVTLILHFVAIWQKYEYFKSDKNFTNCPKFCKNGLSI